MKFGLILGPGFYFGAVAPPSFAGSIPRRQYQLSNNAIVAVAIDGTVGPPWLGSTDVNIPFSLDCTPDLPSGSGVSSASVVINAILPGTNLSPVPVTGTLMPLAPVIIGNVVWLGLGNANAVPGAIYTVQISVTFSNNETVEVDLPTIIGKP